MVSPTRRWLQAVQLLLVVAVCLLLAVSASELVPAAPGDIGGLLTTPGTEAAPDASNTLPRPGGHAVLHALSLCVAVLGATFVLASHRAPQLAGGRCGEPPARRVTPAKWSQTLRLRLPSQVATGVLLQV